MRVWVCVGVYGWNELKACTMPVYTHKHTHTRILKPFKDRQTTRLKVDIAERVRERERGGEADSASKRDTQRDGETDRQTDRDRDSCTDRAGNRVTERARARKGDADRYRDRDGKRKRLSVKYIKYKLRMLDDGLMLANNDITLFNIPHVIYISCNTGITVAVKLILTTERL